MKALLLLLGALCFTGVGCSRDNLVASRMLHSESPAATSVIDLTRGVRAESLEQFVGKVVTVRAVWHSTYMAGGGISGPNAAVMVYTNDNAYLPKENALFKSVNENCIAEATGILRLYDPGAHPSPLQHPPRHLYFDVADSDVTFPG
jgi:hypothetical protein